MSKHDDQRNLKLTPETFKQLEGLKQPNESWDDALIRMMTPPPPPDPVRIPPTFEEACDLVANTVLSAETKGLLAELCHEHNCEISDYVTSWIQLVQDQDQLTFLQGKHRMNTDIRRDPTPGESTCAWCSQPFTPSKFGQKYCPPDEESSAPDCGRQAHLAELNKHNKQLRDDTPDELLIIAKQRAVLA